MKWRAPFGDMFGMELAPEPERHDGLTRDEGRVMDSLTEAIYWFDQLEVQHPMDTHEFYTAIHGAQDLLAVRIARRLHPEGWPTHG